MLISVVPSRKLILNRLTSCLQLICQQLVAPKTFNSQLRNLKLLAAKPQLGTCQPTNMSNARCTHCLLFIPCDQTWWEWHHTCDIIQHIFSQLVWLREKHNECFRELQTLNHTWYLSHYKRCPYKLFLSGVIFSRFSAKTAYIWLFMDILVFVFLTIFWTVKFGIPKSCLCNRNGKYQVWL